MVAGQPFDMESITVRFASWIKLLLNRLFTDRTFANGILFTLFAFLNNGISFLLLIILAKYIPPDGYGQLNLFNTFVVIAGMIISLSSGSYISVSYFKHSHDYFRKVVTSISIISLVVFIFLLILLLLFSELFEGILGLDGNFQIAGLLICFFQVFNTINLEIWRLEEKPVKYGFYSISVGTLNLVLTLILIINCNQDWTGRIYAQFLVSLMFSIFSIMFLLRRHLITWSLPGKDMIRQCVLFGLPLIPHLASSWIRQGLDRYIVNSYHTISDVGLFSYAMNFANIILIIGTAFNASNSVFLFKNLSEPSLVMNNRMKKYNISMMMFLAFLSVLVITGSFIFITAITPQYSGSMKFLIPLCLSMFFQSIYLLYVNYIFFFGRTKTLMFITFSVSVLHMALSFILTKYSILYTSYISLFSSILIFLMVRSFGLKLVNKNILLSPK